MRTVTISTDVYTFDELSDQAKKNVLNKYWDINVDHTWWDFIYEDAKAIGFNITGFSLDSGTYCNGHFKTSAVDTAELILANHGEPCDTFKVAVEFKNKVFFTKDTDQKNIDDFENKLRGCYLDMLRREYDYLISEKAIINYVTANEWEFTKDGNKF